MSAESYKQSSQGRGMLKGEKITTNTIIAMPGSTTNNNKHLFPNSNAYTWSNARHLRCLVSNPRNDHAM